jgi:DNA modification methylase
MSILLNGNCLELLDTIEDNSVDLIYCDLPYATDKFGSCTACEWDKPINLEELWSKLMKKKKINTPIFMSCNVKLGYELIRTAPKKCPFRYDLIWVKSTKAGFLSSKRMPLRSHELVYVFYEKLPFYDLSSHTHKFLNSKNGMKGQDNLCYGSEVKQVQNKQYDPPLPHSVIKEDNKIIKGETNTYNTEGRGKPITREPAGKYDPPLPDSVIKEDIRKDKHITAYGKNIHYHNNQQKNGESIYDPPLPDSILEIKSTRGKHSTEKPVDLIKWILKYYSKEGDIVLDPTMGSGSSGVACKEMKRDYIGIEMNPEIYEVAVNRIEG